MISGYFQPLGTVVADESKPFTGTISSFDNLTYPQMLSLLDGSAGGNWLDLSSTSLSSISDVSFTVPSDATYRMVVDGISGVADVPSVPEPASLACLGIGSLLLLTRKRRYKIRSQAP